MLANGAVIAAAPGEVPVGEALRDVSMNGLSVPAKKLSAYKGKPLIINVWASWCGPCRQEMPSLMRLANRHSGKQFNVIGISTDDYPEKAYSFVEQTGITFDNFIDRKLQLENMLGANKLPLTVLVDKNGKVLSKHYGAQDWASDEAIRLIERSFKINM
jgi:thiol-disulfide isomerase/thioredoxin